MSTARFHCLPGTGSLSGQGFNHVADSDGLFTLPVDKSAHGVFTAAGFTLVPEGEITADMVAETEMPQRRIETVPTLRKELEASIARIADQTSAIETLTREVNHLKLEASNRLTNNESATADLEAARAALVAKQGDYENAVMLADAIRQQLGERDGVIADQAKALGDAQATIDELTAKLADAEARASAKAAPPKKGT